MDYKSAENNDASDARRAKVVQIRDMVKDDIKHWEYAFKRMRQWRDFARGLQWPGSTKDDLSDPDREYTANVTMRHLKQRTASIYAKNPSYLWRRSKRMTRSYWDGTAAQLQVAQQIVSTGNDQTGMYGAILQEAQMDRANADAMDKVGDTLKYLYEYFIREQTPPTKKMMKKQVLTSMTCGVAYMKQTFQRATDYPPDVSRSLSDHMAQLARIERLSAEMDDGDVDPHSAEAEELRLIVQDLEKSEQIILREGLALDYPESTNIIPDQNMTYLPGFVGCGHVTEQYVLTPEQIKEFYGVDIKQDFTAYDENSQMPLSAGQNSEVRRTTARVWEVWDRGDNLVYTVCDGYPDFLEEPHSPITYTERFYPWFVYAPNAVDDPDDPFPPSDVELMMCQQQEINRSGEALRQHRFAARPGWVSGADLPVEDAMKIEQRKAHSLVILKSLSPEQNVNAKFQAFPTSPIDPNLYQTNQPFQDILRTVGTQEANLGGASGATATETSIAESSRQSTLGSAIDEFDDLLAEMARAGGQILLQEMSAEQVKAIVGPAAVWPEQSREDVAREIHLEVMAGSSGRPNQAQEVAIMERLYPLLFQIPGLSYEQLARHGVKVLDDAAHYEDWVDMNQLPIMAMNGIAQAQANRGEQEGGGDNAQRPQAASTESGGPPVAGQQGFGMGGDAV